MGQKILAAAARRVGVAARDCIAAGVCIASMAVGGALAIAASPTELERDAVLVADAVCGEARGEPWEGQMAVAYVVENRRHDPAFPDSLRAVVLQPHQFEGLRAASAECRRDRSAWRDAYHAVLVALSDGELNRGALFFDNCASAPGWMRRLELVERIGQHCFYSPQRGAAHQPAALRKSGGPAGDQP